MSNCRGAVPDYNQDCDALTNGLQWLLWCAEGLPGAPYFQCSYNNSGNSEPTDKYGLVKVNETQPLSVTSTAAPESEKQTIR
ncbi:hypothetical protein Tcan_02646 [Toxocara canis]|uniref:Uncharacterized protein n=1 Tax=Toxocara canis TaxID=6265 RepID=A0A0B2UWY8_TOXCA|nr:hypothetical protein Tcan_02646 [Toxocara canis]